MPPDSLPRGIMAGTAAAVVAATLVLPGSQGGTIVLEARQLPLPASSPPARDSMPLGLMAQQEAAGRVAGYARAAHLEHVRHVEHAEHVDHMVHVQAARLELASARQSYSGRHRVAPAPAHAPAPPVLTSAGGESPEAYAESVVGSGQYGCLYDLWMRESGWQWDAANPGSGAYGIPQSLPADKMASAGADWQTNPITQVRWGLGYIDDTYGTPCGAWAHEESEGWY